VYVLDEAGGTISLGPAVREPDGRLRHYGAVPAKGATVRIRNYWSGGGASGNVTRQAIRVLRSSIPFVATVENRRPASGGVDGEEVEQAKARGPILLRTRDRAVTAEDYEVLARDAAPEVSRVRCVPAGDGAEPGTVRVLLVPAAADVDGRLRLEQLIPSEATMRRVAAHLDERRVLGARVLIEPPSYQGVTVVARLRARSGVDPRRLQRDALAALYRSLSPLAGGPDGHGWPFGRPVHVGEVYATLARLRGVELVEDARVFAADPTTGQRGQAAQRIELDAGSLVFSYEHQVLVEA
jgi:predicted phage baseplate assembly protein